MNELARKSLNIGKITYSARWATTTNKDDRFRWLSVNIDDGMVVAKSDDRCPIWNDILPYKSVTVVCKEEDFNDVIFWLAYVHGGEYSKTKKLPQNKIAIRSNYQAW